MNEVVAGAAQPNEVIPNVRPALRPQRFVVDCDTGPLLAQLARLAAELEVKLAKQVRVFDALVGPRVRGHGRNTCTR